MLSVESNWTKFEGRLMQLASGNRCDQRREGHSSSAHAQNDGGSEGKVLLEKEPELRADMSQGESVPICHVIIGTLRV